MSLTDQEKLMVVFENKDKSKSYQLAVNGARQKTNVAKLSGEGAVDIIDATGVRVRVRVFPSYFSIETMASGFSVKVQPNSMYLTITYDPSIPPPS